MTEHQPSRSIERRWLPTERRAPNIYRQFACKHRIPRPFKEAETGEGAGEANSLVRHVPCHSVARPIILAEAPTLVEIRKVLQPVLAKCTVGAK